MRDWLHVEDHCQGIELILTRGEVGEVYNIGGGAELANLAVIDAICACVDRAFARDASLGRRFPEAPAAEGRPSASLKTFVRDRPGHDRRYAIDSTKIETRLGYRAARGFESGLAATLGWYLDNEAWWRAVQDGRYRDWVETNYVRRS